MLTYARAHASDVRALAVAIVLGSGAGLGLGGAYLALGTPNAGTVRPAAHVAVQIHPVGVPAAGVVLAAQLKPAPTLRQRIVAFPSAAAQPFRFAKVAKAQGDEDCLAQAVYYEARGETSAGQAAVAQVVLNRVRHPAFPKTVCGVVHQRTALGCQFSFACAAHGTALDPGAWRRARQVAAGELHGSVMAAVGDATHFQTAAGGAFRGLLKVAQVGAHVFYRFGGHAGSAGMFRQAPQPSLAQPSSPQPLAAPPFGRIMLASLTVPPAVPASTPAPKPSVATAARPAAAAQAVVKVSAPTASPRPALSVTPTAAAPAPLVLSAPQALPVLTLAKS